MPISGTTSTKPDGKKNTYLGLQAWLKAVTGAEMHDFAGSIVVHAVGGWMALAAVRQLGARIGRYDGRGRSLATPPSCTIRQFGRALAISPMRRTRHVQQRSSPRRSVLAWNSRNDLRDACGLSGDKGQFPDDGLPF